VALVMGVPSRLGVGPIEHGPGLVLGDILGEDEEARPLLELLPLHLLLRALHQQQLRPRTLLLPLQLLVLH
jgi:hypothetical protein